MIILIFVLGGILGVSELSGQTTPAEDLSLISTMVAPGAAYMIPITQISNEVTAKVIKESGK